uniref:glycosyltransferase family 4 protein n=1 Tax=Enterocloster aldenensis TaxID=358742 RepID=UPI00140D6545
MKVLSMAWTIYDDKLKVFSMNYTGGGMVIKNICEYIGREVESFLFIGQCQLPQMRLENINIVGTNVEPEYKEGFVSKNEKHLKVMVRLFEDAIHRIKPDIVNFHGLGALMLLCIQVCRKWHIPYVYTEHLYIGFNKEFDKYDATVSWEKTLYNIPDLKIIAVSTGIKKRILRDFPQITSANITVIENGTDFTAIKIDSNLKDKYLLRGKKVLLCVGTLLARKNQRQIVRAFSLLPNSIRENVKVLFCGVDKLGGALQQDIIDAGMQEHLIYVGAINNSEMKQYYSVADGLIMPSLAEGLSIAALEAIAYGIPVIMFADSECADDLNDTNVVCFAEKRSDRCLAEAIEKWYLRKWNKKYIIDYSEYFSMNRVAEKYIAYYENRLLCV